MAIQFHCSGCGEPIEVDEPYAGQTAACPYCHQVVSVPVQSTYVPSSEVPTARGVADSAQASHPQDSSPATHPPPPAADRQRTAITYGNYALVLSALSLGLFLAVAIVAFVMTSQMSGLTPGAPLDVKEMTEQLKDHPAIVWTNVLSCGMIVFALGGLLFGIYSVTLYTRENWRGWLAVVASGLLVLFLCCGVALMILMMGAA